MREKPIREEPENEVKEPEQAGRDLRVLKEALLESEERFHSFSEDLPVLVCEILPDFSLTFANPAFCQCFGLSPGEYVGRSLPDLFPEQAVVDLRNTYLSLTREQPETVSTSEIINAHGTRWLEWRHKALIDKNGTVFKFRSIGMDVTEHKYSEKRLHLAESSIESSKIPTFLFNRHSYVVRVNEAACRSLGYSREELCTMRLRDFDPNFPTDELWEESWHDVRKRRKFQTIETVHRRKDGSVFPVEVCSSPVIFGDEEYEFSFAMDITVRMSDQEALRESEERYRTAIEFSNDGVAIVEFERIVFVNRRYAEIFGYDSVDEIIGQPVSFVVHHDDKERITEISRKRRIGEPVPSCYEFKGTRKDGSTVRIEVSAARTNYQGKPVSLVFLRDITDRKVAEERLKRQLRLEKALASASASLLRSDTSYKDNINAALNRLLEAADVSRVYIFENVDDPKDGLCHRQIHEVCAPGVSPEIDNPVLKHSPYNAGFSRWRELLSRGNPVTGDVAGFPQSEREILEPQDIVSMVVLPLFTDDRWYGFIGFDETRKRRKWQDAEIEMLRTAANMLGGYFARIHAQEALRDSEARYEETISGISECVWRYEVDEHGGFAGSYISPVGERMLGLPAGSIGHSFDKILSYTLPEDLPACWNTLLSTLSAVGEKKTVEYRVRRSNGELFWVRAHGTAHVKSNGNIVVFGTATDITQIKQDEEALSFANTILRTQQEASPDGILIVDKDGEIVSYNQRLIDMWDIPAEVMESRSDEYAIQSVLARVTEPEEFLTKIRYIYEHPDEKSHDEISLVDGLLFERYSAPMLGPNGENYGRVWYFRDITKRKQTEEKLREGLVEKEALLSEIHHRVKNNLQIIASLLEMSKSRARTPEAVMRLGEAHAKIFTIALIHSQLYQSERFDEVNMETHTHGLLNRLKSLYGGGNRIITRIHIHGLFLPVTLAIPCALILNELISNVFKYAFESRESGNLLVSMERKADGIIVMEVADDGVGIKEEIDIAHTDSLGLKLVRNLVHHQLRGTMDISVGPGTRVRIEFPA